MLSANVNSAVQVRLALNAALLYRTRCLDRYFRSNVTGPCYLKVYSEDFLEGQICANKNLAAVVTAANLDYCEY